MFEIPQTRQMVLRKAMEMANHNVSCYSSNLRMDTPKAGHEADWKKAKEQTAVLRQMLDEYAAYSHTAENGQDVHYSKYIGTFDSWSTRSSNSEPAQSYVSLVHFRIDTPEWATGDEQVRLFEVDTCVSDILLSGEYDVKRHKRYYAGVTANIVIYVDTCQFIRKLEWVASDADIVKAQAADDENAEEGRIDDGKETEA